MASRPSSLCCSKEKENQERRRGTVFRQSFIASALIWILILFHTIMRESRLNDPNG